MKVTSSNSKAPSASSQRTHTGSTVSHGKEKLSPQGSGSKLSIDELAFPGPEPPKDVVNKIEQPAKQVCKWKLKHHAASREPQRNHGQVLPAAALHCNYTCPSPPAATVSWANTLPGSFLKTSIPVPSVHHHSSKCSTRSFSWRMKSNEDTVFEKPNLPCLTPKKRVAGCDGSCPPFKRPKLKMCHKTIGRRVPLLSLRKLARVSGLSNLRTE